MKLAKILDFIVKFVLYALTAGLLVLLSISFLSSKEYFVKGYRAFLVQSGSMEPAIMTGDVIVVQEQSSYGENDVVTFYMRNGRVVTHRIVELIEGSKPQFFITKGDANRVQDQSEINEEQVIGKVILVIPKLGYMVAFAKTPVGLGFLLGIPVLLILYDEVKVIFGEVRKPSRKKKKGKLTANTSVTGLG